LFSSIVGLVLKEWMGGKRRTKWVLALAMTILILSILILTYGNYLGTESAL
jgi:L-rhamnose-H+ transport protein